MLCLFCMVCTCWVYVLGASIWEGFTKEDDYIY